jgi:dihydroflavonol-4-reductase
MTIAHHTIAARAVLVTGASGFIGGRLAAALVSEGRRVRALVRDPGRFAPAPGIESFAGDLLRPESLIGIEDGVEVVVHCASLLGKWGTPDALIRQVNVDGTLHLLERFAGRPLRRFVHLSAGGVTGPTDRRVVDETYDCRPATTYERTKLEAERAVLDRSVRLGVPAVVVRPTFTYGPGDPHKLALYRAIRRGRYAFIGDGESVNHPVHVDDLIRGILLAIERARIGEVYIIGGPEPVTKRAMAYAIADALGVRRPFLRIPRSVAVSVAPPLEALGRLLGFEPILTRSRVMMMAGNFGYSIAKARRELGYEPHVTLRDGIAETIVRYVQSGDL